MMRAVAAMLSISLLGCFPNSPRHRTYAQLSEGAAILTGIVMEGFVQTGADCDTMKLPGVTDASCHINNGALGDVGVALIVVGLLGFVATISTAEDDKKSSPLIDIKANKTGEARDLKLPPGVKGNNPNVSAAATGDSAPVAPTTPPIAHP